MSVSPATIDYASDYPGNVGDYASFFSDYPATIQRLCGAFPGAGNGCPLQWYKKTAWNAAAMLRLTLYGTSLYFPF